MTAGELGQRMTERERADWQTLHERIAPIGPQRLDALAAMLALVVARSAGNDQFQLSDAMIFADDPADQSVEAMQHAARRVL